MSEALQEDVAVLVVEDDPLVANLVLKCLRREGYSPTLATTIHAGARALQDGFDVAVIDVSLPDGQGFELLELLHAPESAVGVVMMTGEPTDEVVHRSIRQGVAEFLPKPFTPTQLAGAVRGALRVTQSYRQRLSASWGPGRAQRQSEEAATPADLPRDEHERIVAKLAAEGGLTDRERETLDLMLAGLQNADIADDLDISANTVKYHVRNILTKLGLGSRTELFRFLIAMDED